MYLYVYVMYTLLYTLHDPLKLSLHLVLYSRIWATILKNRIYLTKIKITFYKKDYFKERKFNVLINSIGIFFPDITCDIYA